MIRYEHTHEKAFSKCFRIALLEMCENISMVGTDGT